MSNFRLVQEFHEKFGHYIAEKPTIPNQSTIDLRLSLIDEERDELDEGIEKDDIVAMADALTDMLYVIYGFGLVLGVNLDETFAEVHKSNMSKLGSDGKPVLREDGKILKGPNYKPPNLKNVIEKQNNLKDYDPILKLTQ